jgi:hypothetical protein
MDKNNKGGDPWHRDHDAQGEGRQHSYSASGSKLPSWVRGGKAAKDFKKSVHDVAKETVR